MDGNGQCHSTETVKNTLDPKWNSHYDLYIGKNDSITISVWNHRKVQKRQGSGFLGCVRIVNSLIQRLKDTGCKYFCWVLSVIGLQNFLLFYQFIETITPISC